MIVGFCSTAMNRRWQLERTLEANLSKLRGTGSFLALVDYHSADSLESFVRGFAADLRSGTLIFFRTEEPTHYHSSKAKNLAHRLAMSKAPDVLFNLDADNYLSIDTLALVEEVFGNAGRPCFHNWSGENADGSSGRVALRPADWVAVGGYDEELMPASWQDLDLLIRCRAAGIEYVHDRRGVPSPVPNSMRERVAHLETDGDAADRRDPTTRYFSMYQRNLVISMGRPARLRVEDQRRFSGVLNFTETRTI